MSRYPQAQATVPAPPQIMPTYSLLHLLRADDDSVLHLPVTNARLVEEVAARVGTGATGWAIENGRLILAELAAEPFTQFDRRSCSETRLIEAIALWVILRLSGVRTITGLLSTELTNAIRASMADSITVDLLLRCVRAAHAGFTRELFDFCEKRVPAEDRTAMMRSISENLFEGMETLSAAVTEKFTAERNRWFAGSVGKRFELVSSILEGAPVDPRAAMHQLRYELTLHHVALVLWQDEVTPDGGRELENAAVRLLSRIGCSSMLLLPAEPGRLWAWGGRATRYPDELRHSDKQVDLDLPAHVHVASGLPGYGVAGFRRSHEQAVTAERVGRTTEPGPFRLCDYGDLELVILLGNDAEATADFVRRELGPLAADDRTTATLRETVRCLLDNERGVAVTAKHLHIAKNTVVYRVKKAEQLLGRSLREDHLRLHLALHLAERLGSAVLAEQGPKAGPRTSIRAVTR
ncbi:PucR family transcriptional regulator [Micromonospora sp. NBS 11-29]|uniref:PucR family transcriptional regulator n=1 Tax=Micromonospora sp. NBS 11-29 TaxID=1960879 RepID=UPI0011235FAB|nr:helix-turn-helix domain-containing protein [Micromonospora sp. NBS 11-29]